MGLGVTRGRYLIGGTDLTWICLVLIPALLGVALVLAPQVQKWKWLLLIGAINLIEVTLVGSPSASWEPKHVFSLWLLSIFIPWAGVTALIVLAPKPSKPIVTALGVPAVYFLLLVIGLVMGDSTGRIPQ